MICYDMIWYDMIWYNTSKHTSVHVQSHKQPLRPLECFEILSASETSMYGTCVCVCKKHVRVWINYVQKVMVRFPRKLWHGLVRRSAIIYPPAPITIGVYVSDKDASHFQYLCIGISKCICIWMWIYIMRTMFLLSNSLTRQSTKSSENASDP